MVRRGDTFQAKLPPSHLWLVITTPTGPKDEFVFVNITTVHGTPEEDHTCILRAGDHPFVKHDSWVRYGDAFVANAGGIAANAAAFRQHPALTHPVLKRVVQGA